MPRDAGQRHDPTRSADILAIGEEVRVRVEIGARRRIGLRVFDLLVHGIGVDHDPDRARQGPLAQPGRAAQVDQRIDPRRSSAATRSRDSP